MEFDEEAFKVWLENQVPETASWIALRCLLRFLPYTFSEGLDKEETIESAFSFFGTIYIEWVALTYGPLVRDTSLKKNAQAEARRVKNELNSNLLDDFRSTFAKAIDTFANAILQIRRVDPAVFSSDISRQCSEVVADVLTSSLALKKPAPGPYRELLSALEFDQSNIENGLTADQFHNLPLWQDEVVPSAVAEALHTIGNGAPGLKNWADWYEQSVIGSTRNQSLHGQLANLPPDDWAQGIAHVDSIFSRLKAEYPSEEREQAEPQDDNATATDRLGRLDYAKALAALMSLAYVQQIGEGDSQANDGRGDSNRSASEKSDCASDGFAMLLHAPWGKGKTSLWKLLKQRLENHPSTQEHERVPHAGRWITVDFNAWEHEHRGKPWWPFLQKLKHDLSQSSTIDCHTSEFSNCDSVKINWRCWHLFFPYGPMVFSLVCSIVLALVFIFGFWGSTEAFEDYALGVQALLISTGILYLVGRGFAFGTKKIADFHDDLSKSQMQHFGDLFHLLVGLPKKQPICIFIDDLDRCNATYVVEFLESIQTHFRNRNVFYVVAADRKWLRSAFEQHYSGFKEGLSSEREHPLGLLFLEKIFQLSVGVPDASDRNLRFYWKSLLDDRTEDGDQVGSSTEGARDRSINESGVGIGSGMSGDQTSEENNQGSSDISSGEVERQAKHLLSDLVDILPNNPRSLKRMINLYSIYLVSREIVGAEEKELPTLTMARWIIFEQRFLELSEALLAQPERLVELIHGSAKSGSNEDIISRYSGDQAVRAVLGYTGKIEGQITDDHIKILKKFG